MIPIVLLLTMMVIHPRQVIFKLPPKLEVKQVQQVQQPAPVKPRPVRQVPADITAYEQAVNNVRVGAGVRALRDNAILDASAKAKADYLCESNTWGHGDWVPFFTHYNYYKAGENLAFGFTSVDATISGWVNSPTHHANMLDPVYTEQGIGIRECFNYQGWPRAIIVANHFGRPE